MKLFKSIAITAVAAILVTVAPAAAHAGTYTLPNGQKITTSAPKHVVTSRPHAPQSTTTSAPKHVVTSRPHATQSTTTSDRAAKTPHHVERTTLEQFRSKYPTHVTVKRGDTLWHLAATYRGDGHQWPTVAKLNGIKGTTIYVGQQLRVR